MKLKKILQMTLVLALPVSFISCGDEKSADDTSEVPPSKETLRKGHLQIGEEMSGVMNAAMTEISLITDLESVQALVVSLEMHKATLQELEKEAQALDPPTEKEKEVVQNMAKARYAEADALIDKAIGAIEESSNPLAVATEFEKAMADEEMEDTYDKLKEIYGIEDE